jgi:hypothetical protein
MLYFNEGTEVVVAKPIIEITDDSKHSETENINVAASVSATNALIAACISGGPLTAPCLHPPQYHLVIALVVHSSCR